MRIISSILTLMISFCLTWQCLAAPKQPEIKRLDGSTISSSEIERTITRLMNAARVTGLGVAIINDSKVVYVKSFGFRNKEEQKLLTEQTVMRGASFTKVVFTHLVMQLVEEGMIDLDKPVYQYLEKPLPEYEKYQDLSGDERYKLMTARMLLNHTSGFPNSRWFNADEKLDIKFTPGSKYSYSGEGINLLQFVIEVMTGKSVAEMMRERIFKPFGMIRTSMTWEDRFGDDYAVGYDESEKPLGHKKQGSRAAGSMDTTISDYARFTQAVMQGKGLKARTKKLMLTPQIQILSKRQFPTPSTETTDENRKIQLSWGLGWGLFRTPVGRAYFHGGHDDGWENYVVCFAGKGIGIVLITNSSNGESIFKELLETLIKDKYSPWKWQNYIPYDAPPQ
ncbi:MAG TPA: serine hydrolase domain-containing protein [Blastocatellia bacterium]|nr:serine hydrolase domain-containing protein [Blastocatellia bacterium]